MKDTYRHQGMRNKLAETLQKKGISDRRVINAVKKIPRHLFMDSSFEDHAYQDKAFPIAASQTISQPYTVAFQTELLEIKRGAKILEIGTGSGYQTAMLLELGAAVYTIERQKELFKKTNLFQMFSKLDTPIGEVVRNWDVCGEFRCPFRFVMLWVASQSVRR